MRRLRIPAAVLALTVAACAQVGPTGRAGDTPTPQFSYGLTPLVNFSPPPLDPNAPACEYPERLEMPDWLPPDLPLPEGTYASQLLEPAYGYERAIFVVPHRLDVFTNFVLSRWPPAGWTLGRGDSEPGEVEDQFTKPPSVGAFKAQSVYCNPGFALMILIFAEDSSEVGENPNTNSGSPLPGTTSSP